MEIAGQTINGAQNIFFAQLADPNTTKFSVDATRFMAGKFPFMMFGLPGARLSQEQTALAANITPAYLGQIERNEKNPTILTIEKLCTVFNISLSEFFSNHKPASNDDVFLNRITVMLSNRTDVEKEKIYRLIKTALSLSDTD